MRNIKDTRKKRGFSLAEVIVAMAVIVIITGAAISLIGSHIKTQTTTVQNIYAANIVENAIECFRYANEANEETKFEKVFFSYVYEDEISYAYNETENKFTFDSNGVDVTITINENTITVKAGNIEEKTFTKR